LADLEKEGSKSEQIEVTSELLQEQKKVILSMLLEISRLCKAECLEKGLVVEEMLKFAINFMNQHQKYYDMLTYHQIKNFHESSSELERACKSKVEELKT
jgi:hypothetical protein